MAAEPISPQSSETPPQADGVPVSEQAANSTGSANPAKPSFGGPPLPPRIDAGDDLDHVLGEVSRIFGQSAGESAPLAALANDTINDHMADMKAAESSTTADRTAQHRSADVAPETAADLFRPLPPIEQTRAAAVETATAGSKALHATVTYEPAAVSRPVTVEYEPSRDQAIQGATVTYEQAPVVKPVVTRVEIEPGPAQSGPATVVHEPAEVPATPRAVVEVESAEQDAGTIAEVEFEPSVPTPKAQIEFEAPPKSSKPAPSQKLPWSRTANPRCLPPSSMR